MFFYHIGTKSLFRYPALFVITLACVLGIARGAEAETCTYAFAGSGTYNTAGNWDCGHIPGNGDDVVIPTATTTLLSVTPSSPTVRSITINGTGVLRLNSSVSLFATSSVSITGAGTFSGASSTVSTGALTIAPGGTFSLTSGSVSTTSMTNNGTLQISTGVVTSTGAVLNGGSILFTSAGILDLQADFSTTGTFSVGTSTLRVSGGSSQSLTGANFNNFSSIKTAGTASLTSSSTVVGTLVTSGGGGVSVSSAGGMTILGAVTIGSGTTYTVGAGTSTNALTFTNAGTLTLTGGTATSSGILANSGTLNGGTGRLVIVAGFTDTGTFAPDTGTVRYATSSNMDVTSNTYYNLELMGGVTYTLTDNTTSTGATTVFSGNTLAASTYKYRAVGTITNAGLVTTSGSGFISHPAESVALTTAGGTATSTMYANGDTPWFKIEDSNRNMNGSSAETLTFTLQTASGDQESVTLTETGTATGIFTGVASALSIATTHDTNDGQLTIPSSEDGYVGYTDNQDVLDATTTTVSLIRIAASTGSSSGGSGGGGSSYQQQNVAATPSSAETQALLDQLKQINVQVNTLLKLPDDGNPMTQEDTAVYFVGADGKRHAFPNAKIYFTWYSDFRNIAVISAQHLATIPLGSNVRYKPGIRMIKFATDPKVYAVSRAGVLRWVKTEELATALYGAEWNKRIDDLSDAFFTNYSFGADIVQASDFDPAGESAAVSTISDDVL